MKSCKEFSIIAPLGLPFIFCRNRVSFLVLRHEAYLAALAKRIVKVARDCDADLIHAHSPALNGLAARRAARYLKKPWIYELRYYEQDAAVDSGQTNPYSACVTNSRDGWKNAPSKKRI